LAYFANNTDHFKICHPNKTMSNHKATPEQWQATKERAANGSGIEIRLLELRSRIEQLEAQASNCQGILDSSTPPMVATDEELLALKEKLWNKYKTIGYLGEEFMYDSSFGHALSDYRAILKRWGAK